MFAIFVAFSVCVLVLSILTIISWWVHMKMTQDNSYTYGYGNYKLFVKEFKKYNWDIEDGFWHNSMWDRYNDCQIHADIIKFNGIGMVINNPLSYIRIKLFIHNEFKSRKVKKEMYKWE